MREACVPEPLVGDWSSGYALGRQPAREPDATAVFASNDHMALGLLRALHEAGRRAPDGVRAVIPVELIVRASTGPAPLRAGGRGLPRG
ncbi:hypothetical protein Sfulv_02040 [Streptomyces fulvorobeus]|uniref:Transcriptional regulator LacI/GalR-like sensor domain-containing protein n=1 Tax=Streptomyces fulvorobeus TaxID=284028 RepID=A0A7J0C0C3_9ACTN|nr:hypothetical protein Sfulv_02040 [Streptomyces fulvorobeus]